MHLFRSLSLGESGSRAMDCPACNLSGLCAGVDEG